MEQTECSETSAYKIQKPENYPEERVQHSEQGESLKSGMLGTLTDRNKSWFVLSKEGGLFEKLMTNDNQAFREKVNYIKFWVIQKISFSRLESYLYLNVGYEFARSITWT